MKFKKFPFLNTKGFILKKDVYTTNLLFEHKRINFSTKNLIPFRNIIQIQMILILMNF